MALSKNACPAPSAGHVHDGAHAKPEQDALFHPAIHAPARGRSCIRLRRANAAVVQPVLEFLEKPQVLAVIAFGSVVEERLNLLLQHACLPRRPKHSSTPRIFSSFSGCGAQRGSRHTGSSSPMAAIAAFTGMGFDSMKFTSISGRYLRCRRRACSKLFCRQRRTSWVISAGISLEATEIRPFPPSAMMGKRQRVVAGKHRELFRQVAENGSDLADVAGGFFDSDDVFDFGEPFQRGGVDICAGSARHVIDDQGQRNGRGDGLVVLVETLRASACCNTA